VKNAINPPGRLVVLDGLRGLAALVVVIYHFCSAFFPRLIPDQTRQPFWLACTPVGILYNGPFAVSVFFVLSGFVLYQAASKRKDPLYVLVLLRYLRLALPAAASVIFAWALLKRMPNASARVNAVIPHMWMSSGLSYQGYVPSFLHALMNGFVGIFVQSGTSKFNNALWTMKFEALGSLGIYLFCCTPVRSRLRVVVGVAVALFALIYPIFTGFVVGAVLNELWSTGRLRRFSPMTVLAAGILLGFPANGFAALLHLPHMYARLTLGNTNSYFATAGAALILYAVLFSPRLSAALSSRVPHFLGVVSFPLYLVHVPLLYTVMSVLYLRLIPFSAGSLALFVGTFLVLSFLFAFAGERWIDQSALRLIGGIRTRLRQRRARFANAKR
jgi:peptidoglycan/LPS O-acetylase OafA/YrhL